MGLWLSVVEREAVVVVDLEEEIRVRFGVGDVKGRR